MIPDRTSIRITSTFRVGHTRCVFYNQYLYILIFSQKQPFLLS
jgi:hypothetical protein